jgi:hypothetical protein
MTSRPECREVRQRKEATCLGHDAHAIRVCEGALQRVQRQRAAATSKAHHAQLAHLQGRAQQTQHRDMDVSEGAKAAGEAMQEGSLGAPPGNQRRHCTHAASPPTSRRAMARQMSVKASRAKPPHPVSAIDRESSTATTTW